MEKENLKVSIIIPIYNVEKYIIECLNSILAQTYKNLEIILIDDGSPDSCPKIIDDYASKDSRFLVIHKENGGVSSAKNEGLRVATGDYICFVDPDDYVCCDYVEYLLNLALLKNSDVAITKDLYTTYDTKETYNENIDIITAESAASDILLHKIPIGVYCKIFRKEFLDKFQIKFRQDIYIGEGFNFNIDAFQQANSVTVGYKRVYFYRTDNQNSAVTKFNIKKWENAFYALDCIEKNMIIKTPKMIESMRFAKWYDGCFVLAIMQKNRVLKKFPKMVSFCKRAVKENFSSVFKCKTSKKNKIKALLMFIAPIVFTKLLY